jgi:hemoglobin
MSDPLPLYNPQRFSHLRDPSTPVYTPPGGPPQGPGPSREIYSLMGEENIFLMLDDFYRELEKSSIRSLFPPDMIEASQRSASFFVGLLGGPPLYHQRSGQPMMRGRHMRFRIDEAARRVWLECFERILEKAPEKYAFPEQHLSGFKRFLYEFSAWMVNTAG